MQLSFVLILLATAASSQTTPLTGRPMWAVQGNQADAQCGQSVASAGDVNGDGFDDVVVGAPYHDNGQANEGRAVVCLGSATGLSAVPSWAAEGEQVGALFGFSVASAGDVNGDGYGDVVVGAYQYDGLATNAGRAFVYHGSPSGLSALPDWTAESDQPFANFGYSVASAGDVNGDGFADVIVGAISEAHGEVNEGAAFVFHGSPTGLSPAAGWMAESNQADAYFGQEVASAGDVNGDGFAEVIVGAPSYDSGEAEEGRAFVYYGAGGGLSTLPGWTSESNQPGAYFGQFVASVGDVNGDGFADVGVGATFFDNGQADEGRVFVFHGSPGGMSPTASWTGESNQAGAYYGRVASAGDVDGDGFADMVIGASQHDGFHVDQGRVFVHRGSAGGLSLSADWTTALPQDSALFGWSAGSAGDVDANGLDDIIAGAYLFDRGQMNEGIAVAYYGLP